MRCAAIATGLALLVGASACGSGPDPASTSTSTSTPSAPQESPMADAIVLKQNLPTKVDGTRVVAFCSDATVMGGAMGDVGCRVVVEAYHRAMIEQVPIIGLSAFSDPLGDGGGPDSFRWSAYLRKPIDMDELERLLATTLNQAETA